MPEVIETGKEEVAGDAGQQKQDTGNNDATADGQQNTNQDAAGNQSDEVAGLKAAAAAERTKRQAVEVENTQLQQQMNVAKANQAPNTQQVETPTSLFMQAAKHHGFDPEYMTPAETGQVMDTLLQFMAKGQQDAAFDASHSDLKDIVGSTVNGTFVESPHLLKVYESNPGLKQAFSNLGLSANTKLIAYRMVKNSPEYQATLETENLTDEQKQTAEADAKIKAANSTASISSVQGGGNLDRGAAIAGMNHEEFRQELEKKMAEAV